MQKCIELHLNLRTFDPILCIKYPFWGNLSLAVNFFFTTSYMHITNRHMEEFNVANKCIIDCFLSISNNIISSFMWSDLANNKPHDLS